MRRQEMAKLLKPTSDAVDILHRRFYEGKLGRLKNLEEARANEEIARVRRSASRTASRSLMYHDGRQ